MRFIAVNIDGGYTELRKKGESEDEEIYNCQLLCDSEADSLDDFKQELKKMWADYDVGKTLILRIDKSFEPVYVDI